MGRKGDNYSSCTTYIIVVLVTSLTTAATNNIATSLLFAPSTRHSTRKCDRRKDQIHEKFGEFDGDNFPTIPLLDITLMFLSLANFKLHFEL